MAPDRDMPGNPVRLVSEYATDPDYEEILVDFISEIPNRAEQIRAAWRMGDRESLKVLTHQLKGAGGGYGFPDLSEKARVAEGFCKPESSVADLTAAVIQLLLLLRRIH